MTESIIFRHLSGLLCQDYAKEFDNPFIDLALWDETDKAFEYLVPYGDNAPHALGSCYGEISMNRGHLYATLVFALMLVRMGDLPFELTKDDCALDLRIALAERLEFIVLRSPHSAAYNDIIDEVYYGSDGYAELFAKEACQDPLMLAAERIKDERKANQAKTEIELREPVSMPPSFQDPLKSPEADRIFCILQQNGILDANRQPIGNHSLGELAVLVVKIDSRLQVPNKWQTFGQLWNRNPKSLRSASYKEEGRPRVKAFNKSIYNLF